MVTVGSIVRFEAKPGKEAAFTARLPYDVLVLTH